MNTAYIIGVLGLSVLLTLAIFGAVHSPRCQPGDPGVTIGGVLVKGCR